MLEVPYITKGSGLNVKDIKLNYDSGKTVTKYDKDGLPYNDSVAYGDIDFDYENSDLTITDSIVQAITIRLRWFLNEFKYNTSFGVPYYEDVFVKSPNMTLIRRDLTEEIQKVTEVEEILELKLEPLNYNRELKVNFKVKVKGQTESGEVIVIS